MPLSVETADARLRRSILGTWVGKEIRSNSKVIRLPGHKRDVLRKSRNEGSLIYKPLLAMYKLSCLYVYTFDGRIASSMYIFIRLKSTSQLFSCDGIHLHLWASTSLVPGLRSSAEELQRPS